MPISILAPNEIRPLHYFLSENGGQKYEISLGQKITRIHGSFNITYNDQQEGNMKSYLLINHFNFEY